MSPARCQAHRRQLHLCAVCRRNGVPGAGTSLCACDRQLAFCLRCRRAGVPRAGSQICPHDLQRQHCLVCSPRTCDICRRTFGGDQSLLKHYRVCHWSDRKAITCRWELVAHRALQAAKIPFEYQHVVGLCGLDGARRRAVLDFTVAAPWGYVVLEIDQEEHRSYGGCDVPRDLDVYASVVMSDPGVRICVLRVNPDEYEVAGVKRSVPRRWRVERLVEVLKALLAEDDPPPFRRLFLFHSRHYDDSALPCIASSWPEHVKAVSRCLPDR